MADRLAEGHLAEILQRLRSDGLSWRTITKRLHTEYGVDVFEGTLAEWHRQLTADEERVS